MAKYAKISKGDVMSREDIFQTLTSIKEEVKDRYKIEQAIEDLTPARLRRTGRQFEGLCPFHVEKTPSFKVDASRGNYRCWGCGEAGDVFTLIQTTQNLEFQAAILFGADRLGLQVPDEVRNFVERRPVGKKPKKKLVRYSSSEVKAAPMNLGDAGFIPVSEGFRRPVANREFRMWNNGGRYGANERKQVSYRPEMVHEYRDIDGKLLMCVLRVIGRDKKFFIPARLAVPTEDCPKHLFEKNEQDGKPVAWISVGPITGEAKPIYGMENVREWYARGGRNVLIVEGEKTKDAAHRLISQADPNGRWLVLTPQGGSKSAIYADWGPFFDVVGDRKLTVIQWPDADKPLVRPDGTIEDRLALAVNQMQTVVAQRALDRGVLNNLVLGQVIPPQDVKSGWDVADAEQEGWKPEEVLQYIKNNSRRTDMANLELRKPEDQDSNIDASGREEPDMGAPFDLAGSPAEDQDDIDWIEAEIGVSASDELTLEDLEMEAPDVEADTSDSIDVEQVSEAEIMSPDEIEEEEGARGVGNRYFRCLGYLDKTNFFMSLKSGQVFEMTPSQMQPNSMMHLAPLGFWEENFPKMNARGGVVGVDWQSAVNALIESTYNAGVWNPRLRCNQGARMDGKTVVFHTGTKLYVDGQGTVELNRFTGQNIYAVGPKARMPDCITPFEADSPELQDYIEILSNLDWKPERRELAIMALFGWVAISPICGILDWRPHLWLDGPRGSGKSWVVENLINTVLGDFVVNVLSNSTESGLRNLLSDRAVPVTFDEAEGENQASKERMRNVIALARHSAFKSNAVVAQGVTGGGGARHFSIASTFLLTSIVPQLHESADNTRFCRIKLASGRKHENFKNDIEIPALKLIDERFSDRWIGRMIMRAKDYKATYMHMVHGLSLLGLERRLADVYGSFATGCWLMLRDGVPADEREASFFISSQFNVMADLLDVSSEISEDKDHARLFNALQSFEMRLDGRNNAGSRSEPLGVLLEVACGHVGDDDTTISQGEAIDILKRIGIRPGCGEVPAKDDEVADTVLIHKNSQAIRDILEKTPYAVSYSDVMSQAEDVKMGKTTRFGAALGPSRSIIVPLKHFSIGVDHG
ncbi:hypothetical protein KUV57_12920 [Epibacterium sp. DP7N7-1]|nr:hypothetical protein [Epibacterium sp. DP7N7-1]